MATLNHLGQGKNNPVFLRCKTEESIYISAKPLQEEQKEREHLRKFRGAGSFQGPACGSVTLIGVKNKVM